MPRPDAYRQEAKQTSRTLQDTAKKHVSELQALERKALALGNRVHEGQVEAAMLKERLKGAEERSKKLENALAAAAVESRRTAKSAPAKTPTSRRRRTAGTVAAK